MTTVLILIPVAFAGCSDPTSEIEQIFQDKIAMLESDPPTEIEEDETEDGAVEYYKEKYIVEPDTVKYDVVKTDSTVAPHKATLSFMVTILKTQKYDSREEAQASQEYDPNRTLGGERAAIASEMSSLIAEVNAELRAFEFTYSYKDGEWVLSEVKSGYRNHPVIKVFQ